MITSVTTAKYRIVRDNYSGYEVQIKHWWWPFWYMPTCNTHVTVEGAKKYASNHALKKKIATSSKVVSVLGHLPRTIVED